MRLYINGQDIEQLVLGLIDEGVWVVAPSVTAVAPQFYLKTIDAFLVQQNISRSSINGLVVVRGPGSATSLRSSLALANAWGFAQSIELIGLEKARNDADGDILTKLTDAFPVPMLTPIYEQPAKITPSTKDALGR